jgi:hypothetical protein
MPSGLQKRVECVSVVGRRQNAGHTRSLACNKKTEIRQQMFDEARPHRIRAKGFTIPYEFTVVRSGRETSFEYEPCWPGKVTVQDCLYSALSLVYLFYTKLDILPTLSCTQGYLLGYYLGGRGPSPRV